MSARPAQAFRLSGGRLRAVAVMLATIIATAPPPKGGSALAADAALGAGAWLAQEVRGTVLVRAGGEAAADWQQLLPESPVAGQSEIATGSDGTAVLNNGVDEIKLAPNSRLVLPPEQAEGLLTIIEQKLGRLFFHVGPRPDRSFEVDSPYLVVLVKGTTFSVNADERGDSVAVTEGTVEVRAAEAAGAPGTLLAAGQSASIRAGGGSVTLQSGGTSSTGAGKAGPGKGGAEPGPHGQSSGVQSSGGGTGGGGSGGDGGDGGDGDGGDGGGGDPGDGGGGHHCHDHHGHHDRHAR